MSRRALWLVVLGLVSTCGGSTERSTGIEPGRDAGPPFDPPVAEFVDPEPLPAPEWRVASVGGFDPVRQQLFDGTFAYPNVGAQDGLVWEAAFQGPGGVLGTWGGSYVYAATRITVEEPTPLVVRTDRTVEVFLDGAVQPGDIYGSGRIRVPLLADAGDHVVVIRGLPGRELSAEFWTTEDELFANLADLTLPDLIEGDASVQYAGVPVLNMTETAVPDVEARVVDSEFFEETTLWRPALAPASVTQLTFRLVPKGPAANPGTPVPVTVEVRAPSLDFAYRRTLDLAVVAPSANFRRTFVSPDDGSTQYYSVVPPAGFEAGRDYGLILSLHGAGVEAVGQAASYSPKDWAYLVAATNRRPFGFDWEEWGHANAIFALDDAMVRFAVDPTRVHLAGHSMGGHGSWHVGVMHPGRFAVVGPSAGWESFYSYVGTPRPTYPFDRARAHSDTMTYLTNLARRGVYIIHGDLDDNVPVTQGRTMFAAVSAVSDDVVYHEQPGAGHWWDVDPAPGADCVDWAPMMEMMEDRRLDPHELDFEFTSPSPAYAPSHSFVTLESAESPMGGSGGRVGVRGIVAIAGDDQRAEHVSRRRGAAGRGRDRGRRRRRESRRARRSAVDRPARWQAPRGVRHLQPGLPPAVLLRLPRRGRRLRALRLVRGVRLVGDRQRSGLRVTAVGVDGARSRGGQRRLPRPVRRGHRIARFPVRMGRRHGWYRGPIVRRGADVRLPAG
jgi:hypothetical protein